MTFVLNDLRRVLYLQIPRVPTYTYIERLNA